MVFNGLLFIPLGFLLLFWFPKLRKSWRSGWVAAVLITAGVSIAVELTQAITGLGMADWKDVLGNTLGGMIGIGMMRRYDRFHISPVTDVGEEQEKRSGE